MDSVDEHIREVTVFECRKCGYETVYLDSMEEHVVRDHL